MKQDSIQLTRLLTIENAKTIKGEELGYLTGILYLAPAFESGVINTCQYSTDGCRASCLFTAGRGIFSSVRNARVRKTLWYVEDRQAFMAQLRCDIRGLVKRAKRKGMIPAVRLNGTSDLPAIALQMAREFPDVQFYDYTKLPRPWLRTLPNYHITFSLSESNETDALTAYAHGINVAVAFHVKPSAALPDTFKGMPVIDGDTHDLRFLDNHRVPVIIGLRAKGRAKKDVSGFVQIAPMEEKHVQTLYS